MIINPSINSNDVVFQMSEEQSLKLPYAANSAKLLWFYNAVNTFKDFGSKISTVARSTINNTRQQLKGTVTGVEAMAGYNKDLAQWNTQREMQGFMYCNADARTLVGGIDIPYLDSTNQFMSLPVATAANGLGGTYSGVSTGYFAAGTLLFFKDWNVDSNNGLRKVTAATVVGGTTAVSPALVDEANDNNQQTVRVVGFEFPAGDIALTLVGNDVVLTSASAAFANLAPRLGEWMFVGGDAAITALANNAPFWGRVALIDNANGYVQFDMTTGIQVADAGAAKTVRIFCGTNMTNSNLRRSYTQTRIYPAYVETVAGVTTNYPNVEHVLGTIPDALTFNIKQKSKIDVDMSYIGMDEVFDGKGVASTVPYQAGTFIQEEEEDDDDAYNTSMSIYMMRMSLLDPNTLNPTPYFAYATDLKLDVKNNVTPNDAIGVVGAFDANVGNFEVSASITAYFASVHALAAMRNNASLGLQVIGAQNNAGFVLDLPLMTLSGGMPAVDKDKSVTIPLTAMGAKNKNGYTLKVMFFDYLPSAAMTH
jgi:hypothetical protein